MHVTALQYVLRQVQWKWNSSTESACCVSIRRLQVNLVVRIQVHTISLRSYHMTNPSWLSSLTSIPGKMFFLYICCTRDHCSWLKYLIAGVEIRRALEPIVIKFGEGLQNFKTKDPNGQSWKYQCISNFKEKKYLSNRIWPWSAKNKGPKRALSFVIPKPLIFFDFFDSCLIDEQIEYSYYWLCKFVCKFLRPITSTSLVQYLCDFCISQ